MKIEEMRVIDLRNELKSRGLPVSGSKNNLMERLKSANAQGSGNSSNITSSVTQITQTTPVPVAPRTTLTRSTSVPNGVSLVNSLGTAKILNDAEKMLQEQNISVDEIQQKIQQLQHLNLQLQLQHLDIKNQKGKPLQPTSQAAVLPASQLSNLPANQTGSFSQANGQRETVTSQEQSVGETIKKHVQQLKHINSPPQQLQHLQNNEQIQQVQQQELQQQQQQQLQQQQQQLQQRQQQLQQPQLKQQQHVIAKHAPLEHKKQLQQRQLQLKQLEHQQQYQQHIKQQQLQQQQLLQLQQQQQQQQRLQTNNQLNQQHLLYNHLATSQASIDMKTKVSENNVVTSLPPPQQCQVSISGTPLLHSSPLVCNTNCNGTQLQQSSESTAPNVNSVQLHNVIHFKQPGKPVIFLQRPKQQQLRAQRLFSPTEKQLPSDLSNDIFFQQMTRPNSLSLHHSDVNMEQESNWTSLIEGETRSSSSSPTPVERSPPPYFEAVAGRLSPRCSSNGPFPKLHSRTSSVGTFSSLGHRRSLSVPTVNNSSGLPQEMQKEQQKSGSAMCLDFPEAEEMNNIADNYHGITQELQKAMMIESQNSPDNHNADLLDILGVDTRISSSATAGDGLTSSISNGYSQSSLPVSSSSVEASTSFTHPNSPKLLKSPTTSLPSYQEAVQNTICASSPAAVNFNSSELLSEMHEHSAPLNIVHSQPKMSSQNMDGCLLASCNSPMRVDEDDVDLRNVLYANGYRRDSFDNLRTHTMHNTSIYHVNPCDIFGNPTDGGLIKQGEAGLAFIDVDTGNSEFPESMDLGGNNDSGISVNVISGITFSH